VVFAPDKDVLYIVHADKDRLTAVDFGHHQVRTVDIRQPVSLFDRLMALTAGVAYAKTPDGYFKNAVISPDGKRLYILAQETHSTLNEKTGIWETQQTPLGMKVVQTVDGLDVSHLQTQATDIAISPDGNTLYLRSWSSLVNTAAPYTEIWDMPHHDLLKRLGGQYLTPSRQINGKPVLLLSGMDNGITFQAILDAQTYSVLHDWSEPLYGDWLVIP
jgi:WD40-like Beta Propeller Repeat